MATKKTTKKKSISFKSYGILNAYGEFWTPETFFTFEDATHYIEEFCKKHGTDMSKHKIVIVTITYTLPKKS